MGVVRTITVPDRYYLFVERVGLEMIYTPGPAGLSIDPFAQANWAFLLNTRPIPPYASFDVQIGRIVDPTPLAQPIVCPPKSVFVVQFTLKPFAPFGTYTGRARVMGRLWPVRTYGMPETVEQFEDAI